MVKKGFTLLELLIVISIIGILVAVATASYSSSQKKARNSRRMTDMKNVQTAAEQYYSDHDSTYPATPTFGTEYLPAGWPDDPKPGKDYSYNPTADVSGNMTSYFACAEMEGAIGNANDSLGAGYPAPNGSHFCVKNLQ
jgi:prepilin-type N-terminal cleavage/methylation domain-containing protein